jgi:hypothetical protein
MAGLSSFVMLVVRANHLYRDFFYRAGLIFVTGSMWISIVSHVLGISIDTFF